MNICGFEEGRYYQINEGEITDIMFFETQDPYYRYATHFIKNHNYEAEFYHHSPRYFSTIEELTGALTALGDKYGVKLSTEFPKKYIEQYTEKINNIRNQYQYTE